MNVFLRFGVAAAVLFVAIGAVTVLRPASEPGAGPAASPGPSSSPLPDTADWATFTSERYGFEVRYPADWDVYQANGSNPIYVEDSEFQTDFDRITVGAGFTGLYVASAPIVDGLAPEAWMERYACPCEPGLTDWERLTIDGQPAFARLETGMEPYVSAWVFTDTRVYNIVGGGLLARDRAIFDAFLSTAALHPEDAVDTP